MAEKIEFRAIHQTHKTPHLWVVCWKGLGMRSHRVELSNEQCLEMYDFLHKYFRAKINIEEDK